MKKKDVILDFTSLLDIILIVLFFFVLYSAFDLQDSKGRAEETRVAYEEKLDALEEEKKQLDDERIRLQAQEEKLNAEWDLARALDENAVQNQQALIAFNDGSMLSFLLEKEDTNDDWELRAIRRGSDSEEDYVVGVIHPGDTLSDSILSIFEKAGYKESDVLIVTFAYNGNSIGTHRLYNEIMNAFQEVQALRGNVYLNTVNTSK